MTPKPEHARLVEVHGDITPRGRPTPAFAHATETDVPEPQLRDFVRTIVGNRVLLAAVTLGAVLLAAAYLILAAPTYRSDVLLQVEDKSKSVAGLEDVTSMLSDQSPADTEIEIIRSRSLIGSVVDDLNLTVDVRPRTFPIIGEAIIRHHGSEAIAAPFLGL